MGTSYNITYQSSIKPNKIQKDIDSILWHIDQSVSTYNKTSFITSFNQSQKDNFFFNPTPLEKHFVDNFIASKEVFKYTDGYFDPTVMPLVNYWGFGYKERRKLNPSDSTTIQEILTYVGLDKLELLTEKTELNLIKKDKRMELDFSSIAKGYGVDMLAKWLRKKDIQNYLVEIGGETLAKGVNPQNRNWIVGINIPKSKANLKAFFRKVSLENKAVATSGNYRNFYIFNGKKYAHTINPKTGYPEINSLLSVSVLADDCMTADAFATGFMAMGLEKGFRQAQVLEKIEALFIYNDEYDRMKVVKTNGFTDIE